METIFENIIHQDYLVLLVIITVGILVGKIEVKGISLGLSAVIFVALIFGHFGFTVPHIIQTIGLILFIYSIGIQAGPGFFSSFKKKGLNIIAIASILVIIGAATTIVAMYTMGLNKGMAAGLFAGGLTSTPGLATAIDIVGQQLSNDVSIGYGIAYPFGVVGVIIFVNVFPKLLNINFKTEEKNYTEEAFEDNPEMLSKHYMVKNENLVDKTIADLKKTNPDVSVSRIQHPNEEYAIIPQPETKFQKDDIIRAVGISEAIENLKLFVGPETEASIQFENKVMEAKWVIVTKKNVIGKQLGKLDLFNAYNATVTRIRRSGVDLSPNPLRELRFGDKLLINSNGNMEVITELLGNEDKKLLEADFMPVALGVILSVLVGYIDLPAIGKLGLTGGVLITALSLSRLGKTGPILWTVSDPVNQLILQIGLLFFLSAVGTKAGASLIHTIEEYGFQLFAIGIAITLIPMIVTSLIALKFMSVNFLKLMGALTGGMTSTPGLSAVDSMTEVDAPCIAYATVYPIAMVLLIVCIRIIGSL